MAPCLFLIQILELSQSVEIVQEKQSSASSFPLMMRFVLQEAMINLL